MTLDDLRYSWLGWHVREWWIMYVLGLVMLACFGVLYEIAKRENAAWAEKLKDCTVVGYISGSTSVANTIGANGQVGIAVMSVPGKTGYKCPDGMTYWR